MTDLSIDFPATGATIAPMVDELMKLRLVAAGKERPDLVLGLQGGLVCCRCPSHAQ